ncbi:MAG TPA: amidophosphoribosyltransferase [Candidatus Merdivicinus excrementipullorum]|uniref:Amidophosphoribosyltransferase n=1 Tax=Candidatus Merdivicinus excrementipullorum TaxID=2840867 RepID=A0A9D1FP35_9FIRM|nr:amidophosphoribosyltransferase [Candidatus Merdivicinus excrementipullorum]
MGGFFGVVSKNDCVMDLFFGVDYHSHLGTRRGGMAVYSDEGFERAIHNIENSPFRTKFEKDAGEMHGNMGIGCISDYEPQPLIVRSHLGNYAITTVGRINNEKELVEKALDHSGRHFLEMSGGKVNATELVASIINEKEDLVSGLQYAQKVIDGSMSILLLTKDGVYAARDKAGRTPIILGSKEDAVCASFESFSYLNLGYAPLRELGPGEIVLIDKDLNVQVKAAPRDKMKICAFLWIYYGYPTSCYEGVNVEAMRNRCGEIMAKNDHVEVDYVAGIPDSGTPHAVGYANASGYPFARPFIKYTPTWPRSFMPTNQAMRNLVAHMKLIPVEELIRDKRLLFIDDSIVRGTQMGGTAKFLYDSGAKEVHIRSACPPILFGCKYLNFSRSSSEMELITRRTIMELEGEGGFDHLDEYADSKTERYKKMVEAIGKKLDFTTLGYQTLDGMLEAIGLPKDQVCTYCWTGKE